MKPINSVQSRSRIDLSAGLADYTCILENPRPARRSSVSVIFYPFLRLPLKPPGIIQNQAQLLLKSVQVNDLYLRSRPAALRLARVFCILPLFETADV